MKPFDEYPGGGRECLGRRSGANFAGSYETWLTMALDHVVPASVCTKLGVPEEWADDCANKVLACAACNSFRNRYAPAESPPAPIDLGEFFDFRDRVFTERKMLIEQSHQKERAFFEGRPWLDQ